MKEDAQKRVKTQLILEKLIEAENLKATQEEIDAEIAEVAKAQNMEVEKVKQVYERDDFAMIKEVIENKKAINLLFEAREQ